MLGLFRDLADLAFTAMGNTIDGNYFPGVFQMIEILIALLLIVRCILFMISIRGIRPA